LETCPEPGVEPGDLKGDGQNGEHSQNGLHELLASSPSGEPLSPMNSVEELRGRDDRQSSAIPLEALQEGEGSQCRTLYRNEDGRIDQECQGESPRGDC
jgi:hypothetical protein